MGWTPLAVTSPKHELYRKGRFEREEVIDGIRYIRTPATLGSRVPIVNEVRLMHALKARLNEVVRLERPDVIHAHSPILNAIPALWISRKYRIPMVYEIRAFWEDAAVDHRTYQQNSWRYQATKRLETFVCNHADEVVVISLGLREDLVSRGVADDKITMVGNGVDPGQFSQKSDGGSYRQRWQLEGKIVIGFIGSFYRYEGLDMLVDAAAELAPHRPEMRLLLVGGGEMEEELRRQVHARDLQDSVIMPGRIPHGEIQSIYDAIDILVYPRRSMRLTEIVTPLKPLEAMAMGKAVIASDVGGHRELISDGETGLLFTANDSRALVKAVDSLCSDYEKRARLGTQAGAWVRRERSWKNLIHRHGAIYGRALQRDITFRHSS